jgi:hypothetical protein
MAGVPGSAAWAKSAGLGLAGLGAGRCYAHKGRKNGGGG